MWENVNQLGKVNFLVIHHSVSGDVSAATINDWHLKNGWAGIGYHKVVRANGVVEEGRPVSLQGAHCLGLNNQSIGICLTGNFSATPPPADQLSGLINLIKTLKMLYPDADVIGHSEAVLVSGDASPTECPGDAFSMNKLREMIKEKPQGPAYPEYIMDTSTPHPDENVKVIQRRLGILDDGWFGPITDRTVRNYQAANELDDDGRVGPLTWAKLFN